MPRRARLAGCLRYEATVTSSEMFSCGGSSSCGAFRLHPAPLFTTSGSTRTLARKAFAVYALEILILKQAILRPRDCFGRCHEKVLYWNGGKLDSTIVTKPSFNLTSLWSVSKRESFFQRHLSLTRHKPQDVWFEEPANRRSSIFWQKAKD